MCKSRMSYNKPLKSHLNILQLQLKLKVIKNIGLHAYKGKINCTVHVSSTKIFIQESIKNWINMKELIEKCNKNTHISQQTTAHSTVFILFLQLRTYMFGRFSNGSKNVFIGWIYEHFRRIRRTYGTSLESDLLKPLGKIIRK